MVRDTASNLLSELLFMDGLHEDALIVDALNQNRYDLIIKLAHIAEEHDKANHLSTDLKQRRDKISAQLSTHQKEN